MDKVKRLTERIWYTDADERTDRPVLGYVSGDMASLMVDAGNSRQHAAILTDGVVAKGLAYPRYVAITHWHWDHCYGLSGIGAVSVASLETNLKLIEMSEWEWTDRAMSRRIETGEDILFCDENIRKEYPDRSLIDVKTADIVFDGLLQIDLGGVTCILMKLPNSHSEDSVVAYVPEEKVVFLGDITSEDFHNGTGSHHREKLGMLIEALEWMDFELALHGHDEPRSKEYVLDYLREELELLGEIL
ncbi:MBL fold metallo-hydrolase [Youngiibacter fragilis]|uniref:Metallo-beta-lactamase n=1 Tax=Youngiibacter fragilis 232.1 TaxID=994573 RepID=V7I5I7_9CLOT|nr:MBL fold metallo-hydrolase [Youngiibacter fragilis]ETA81113.1 metallo-beta-lactamase [Youngiibacter fragilis 232.1]